MKKILFFDGDGTLWYPKLTLREKKPHWVYYDDETKNNPHAHLVLTPTTIETLQELKQRNMTLILLSTHPHLSKEANMILQAKINHFQLESFFDEVHATREYRSSKAEFISEILSRRKIPKKHALMVGDSYDWDYKPANDAGIDALLIDSAYRKEHLIGKRIRRTITEIKDVLDYV